MILRIGSSNGLQIHLGDKVWRINPITAGPILEGVMLLSSNDFILTDSNGLYLTAKEEE